MRTRILFLATLLLIGAVGAAWVVWTASNNPWRRQRANDVDSKSCEPAFSNMACSAAGSNSAADTPPNHEAEDPTPEPRPLAHAAFYRASSTDARLAYLDSLVLGDEPSSSEFLWSVVLLQEATPVALRALQVALKIANTREKPEDVAKVFSRAFSAPAEGIRRRALSLVEWYPEPLVVPALASLVETQGSDADAALAALARINNYESREVFVKVATNEQWRKDLRVRAIVLLGESKDLSVRSTLRQLLSAEDEIVRKAAETALKKLEK